MAIARSILITATLLVGCNKSSDHENAATPNTSASTKPETNTEKAVETTGSELVVVEEKLDRPVESEEAETLVAEAREVAGAIAAAITAIDAGQRTEAQAQLDTALDGLTEIERDRPNVDLAIEIWRADKALDLEERETKVPVDTIPLFETLTRVDVPVYSPAEVEARHTARTGQAKEGVSASDKSTDLEIIDANLVYQEIDLPIASTEIQVREAQRLLLDDEMAAAKAALLGAVASFRVLEIIEQAPEYRARKLVWAAEAAFAKGQMDEAKRLLGEAHDILIPLRDQTDDVQAQTMASMLLAEIQPLRDAMGTEGAGQSGQQDAFRRIERNATSLGRRAALRTVLTARREAERFALADSLMWLEKTKTDGLTQTESNEMATTDLQLAESALTKATKEAPDSAKPVIDDLRARVAHLMTLDTAKPRQLESIEPELRGVIFELRMLMLDLGVKPLSTP